MLYVILYLRRVLTHRIDVVPSAPELPVPVFEFQITKLLVKHQTAFPFQISHKPGYAHFGRDLHKHMDMICTALSFKNPYAFPLTQLSQNTACCSTHLSVEHLSSVFWRKNYVIFTVPSGCASSFRSPLGPPFDFLFDTCCCQTARCFNKSKEVLITGSKLKAFRNPQPGWGSVHKKAPPQTGGAIRWVCLHDVGFIHDL